MPMTVDFHGKRKAAGLMCNLSIQIPEEILLSMNETAQGMAAYTKNFGYGFICKASNLIGAWGVARGDGGRRFYL